MTFENTYIPVVQGFVSGWVFAGKGEVSFHLVKVVANSLAEK